MRTGGLICIVLGSLSLLGAIIGGHSAFGPLFWSGLGLYLVHRANQKEQEEIDKNNWNNNKN